MRNRCESWIGESREKGLFGTSAKNLKLWFLSPAVEISYGSKTIEETVSSGYSWEGLNGCETVSPLCFTYSSTHNDSCTLRIKAPFHVWKHWFVCLFFWKYLFKLTNLTVQIVLIGHLWFAVFANHYHQR